MTRAATISVSPHAGLDSADERTLRQFAIAAVLSLVAHALVLALFVAPNYEVARLAGGGASFGLSGGGLGEGSDTSPESEAEAMEDAADDTSEALDEALKSDPQDQSPTEAVSAANQSAPDAVSPATDAAPAQREASAATPPPTSSQKSPVPAQKPPAQKPPAQRAKTSPAEASRRSTGSTGRATPTGAQGNDAGTASATKAASAAPSGGKSNSGTGTGSGSAASGEGNAATSNYTGIVTAHIRRNRRSNIAGAGAVILRLGIASNGRIDSVDIYRSSGSTRFDRQAMRMARMAAPYPKPPAGQGPVLVRIKGS
ncbi:MAG: TonB family protein [Pseudomonadota bacterium]